MNENTHTLRLYDFLVGGEGWGSKAGLVARRKLQQRLDAHATIQLVRVSMTGVRKLDVSFAGDAICGLVKEHLGKRVFCLVDCSDEDVRANVEAAAERIGVPVTIWHAGTVEVAGPALGPLMQRALAFALARPQVRAAGFAAEAGISIASASNLFKKLAADGYLLRTRGTAARGGTEFAYARIG